MPNSGASLAGLPGPLPGSRAHDHAGGAPLFLVEPAESGVIRMPTWAWVLGTILVLILLTLGGVLHWG